jgi:hypothetical protein
VHAKPYGVDWFDSTMFNGSNIMACSFERERERDNGFEIGVIDIRTCNTRKN